MEDWSGPVVCVRTRSCSGSAAAVLLVWDAGEKLSDVHDVPCATNSSNGLWFVRSPLSPSSPGLQPVKARTRISLGPLGGSRRRRVPRGIGTTRTKGTRELAEKPKWQARFEQRFEQSELWFEGVEVRKEVLLKEEVVEVVNDGVDSDKVGEEIWEVMEFSKLSLIHI